MPNLLHRAIQNELIASAKSYPVVTLLGPRQSGKTTLAKHTFPNKPYSNLEAPDIRAFLETDPRRFLDQFPNGAILDEIQRAPILLSYIQVLVDEKKQNDLFILTDSHQPSLQEGITQSLAGRTGILHLLPLSLSELKESGKIFSTEEILFYGGYPRIFEYDLSPKRFYRDYIQTYLERDVKQIINLKDLDQFQRFLSLCASRVGQLIDYTSISNDLGVARQTIKEWLSVLKASYITFTLPPYFENFGKRIIKSPKLYFTDTGLVSHLLGIQTSQQLTFHPLRGQLFENLVINEIMKLHFNQGEETKLFHYRDNHQNEVDLIFQRGLALIAVEIKSSQTFHKSFIKNLKYFEKIATGHSVMSYLVYAGEQEQMVDGVQVINFRNIGKIMAGAE